MRTMLLAMSVLLLGTSSALAADLQTYGKPAVLTFSAEYATIDAPQTGTATITFHNVSKLTSLTADLHKHHQRTFTAFPTSELTTAWNTCNAMKFENKLFHDDGVNAVMVFSAGPDTLESGHLSTAALVTQTQPIETTTGQAEGALKMMMVDAAYANNTLRFNLLPSEKFEAQAATFVDVMVSTECFAPGL